MTQINKKFITFDTKARFVGSDGINNTAQTQEASNGYVGNIPYNSVVFIKDTGQIWTHGRYFCELTDGSGISVGHIYFVNGTQTKATNQWTGDLPFGVTEYYNGLTICYRLPYNGTSSAATLQLGNLAACNVKKNYSESISNHYKGGSIIRLTYYDGIWQTVDYDSNTYDRTISSGYLVAGSQILANSLVRIGVDGKAYQLANNSSSNTTAMVASRTYSTTPCQFGLLYYYSGGLISAGNNLTASRLYEQVPFDLRNSDNCQSSAYNASTNTMSLQVGKPVYIRAEISDYGWYPVAQTTTGTYGGSSTYSRCWTQTEFTKGANYIYVGIAYNNYCVFLSAKNEMYYAYDTNKLQSIEYNHTHKVKINGNEKTVNPATGDPVDLGNYAVNNYLTSDNLNNVITPGFYNSGGSNKCTNKPGDVSAFGLIVVHDADGGYYTQILFDREVSDKSYIRHCNNGTWTSWSEMKFTDTNTWRKIRVNDNDIKNNTLNIKSGTNINVSDDGSGNVSISGDYSTATSSTNGLMSSTDKQNLDNISNHYAYQTAWKSTVKCATWSRLCFVGCGVSVEGNSFLLNVRGTRSNVVYNNTFAINAHHKQNGSIVKITGSRYGSFIQVRIVVDSSGNCYVELYDDANKATNATTQNVNCTFIRVTSGNLTTYTAFTDGTTLPSNYAVAASLTTNNNNLQGNLDWGEITGKPSVFTPAAHTHATSIATTTDTSNITLSPDTKYKLTTGGTSTVFTTAPNTWRRISVKGTSIGSNALNLAAGTGITLTDSSGNVTIGTTGLATSGHTHYVGTSKVQSSSVNQLLTGTMLTGIDNTVDHALLQSGSSRADNATGDTWIFWDSKGGSSTPWGIKHNQASNFIEFYGKGVRRGYIDINDNINVFNGSADKVDGYHINQIAKAYNASDVSLDTVAKSYGSFFGMVTPSGNSVDTYIKTYPINSSSWFHVFQSSWNNQNNGNDDTTNYWITQIVNPAGYNTPYIRSRKGGDDIATNWTSWARILTSEDDLNDYHNHGTLNGTFTQTLANTTADNGWNMIEPNYYKSTTATDGTVTTSNKTGFILKSIRGESSAPNWFLGDYSAGIAFGGGDTKGVISQKYSSPGIRFAGGNTNKPVWYMTITGTSGASYALNTISSNASTGATHAGKTHSVTIAGTSVNTLGGSISAATIGNALTSAAPAAYASDADKIDGLHASSFVRQWDGVYGYANKVCTLTRSDEKGWVILNVWTSSNGSSGSFGIYRIAWEYKSTSVTEKPITITCLCTNLNVYATALTAVRTATGTRSNTFDLYFKFDSAAVFAGYAERHSSSTTIDYSVCEAVEVSAIPTATYTSSISSVYLNTTGNANTATTAKTAAKWTSPIALKIGNKSLNLDGSSGLTYTLADIGFQNTWRDVKVNNTSIGQNTLNLTNGTNITLSNTNGTVSVGVSGTVKKAAALEIDTSGYSSTADSCIPASADVFSVYRCGNNSGAPGKDGNILSMSWSNSSGKYGSQIYVDTDPTGIMALRQRNGSGVWSDWHTVLHSGNYNSYTPIINSASTHATSTTKIIAPTSTGTKGQIVTANSDGYAQWSNPSSLGKVGDADTVDSYHADYLRRGSWNGLLINDVLNISPKTTSKTITIKTTIEFVSSAYMPSIYIKGYAYGMSIPVNLHLVFYVYGSAFVNYSVINTGGWTPKIYLSTYTEDSTKYIAITLIDSAEKGLYFPTLHVDYANPHGANIYYSNWTYSSSTSETIPTSDVVQLSYKSIASNISGNATTATSASYASNIGTSSSYLSYAKIKTVYDWYNTVNKTDNTNKVIDTWSEIVKFVEDFNTDTDLANEFLKYLPKSGGDMTGSITFKDVDGIKMASNDKDVSIWSVWSAERSEGNYGFRLCYAGTGSGDNNVLKLIADNQTGTEVTAMSMTQSGVTTWAKSLTVSSGDISANNGNITGANVWKIISITKNLKVTTEWSDTGIVLNKDTFTTGQGTYAIQLMATSISNNTDLWPAIYSGMCTIYTNSTNNGTESDEIELHSGGHATKKRLYLRTICGASNTYAKLQIASNTNMSSSYDYIFKFKRLI